MLSAIARTSPTTRSLLIMAAAVALILPPPARCMSCSAGAVDCSRCESHNTSPAKLAHRACCNQPTTKNAGHFATANCPTHVQSKTCGCKLQQPERNYVTAQPQLVPSDLVAILPTIDLHFTADHSPTRWSTISYSDPPPPVPHRILHCSWII